MGKLEDVPAATLRDALDGAEDPKAVKRLMVALAYKDGVDVGTLSDRYGIPQSTVYHWLDRLETDPVETAVTDDPRPGRPPKLSADQRATVASWLRAPPRERGLDAEEWSPALLRDRIRAAFGVEYSLGHTRRLLEELS